MRILIATPSADGAVTGNLCSAEQYRRAFVELGHDADYVGGEGALAADVLVALHAVKSRAAVEAFTKANPSGKIVLVLTGTDIYPQPSEDGLQSMRAADSLVVLSPKALEKLPCEFRDKARVIVQGVPKAELVGEPRAGFFDVAMVANLRAVKDPLLAAEAAKLMAPESKLRIRHAGAVLEEGYRALAEAESAGNSRYEWLGRLDPAAARQLIAGSVLLLVTSLSEGAGRVVGEAVTAGVPVLSTRVDGVVGLVGDDYPGLFPVGDAASLAELLKRAETDPSFIADLRVRCRDLAAQFAPEREREAWRELIEDL